MRLLAPHFQRAVTISNLFDKKRIEVATFGSALDSFALGIVLVDDLLGIRSRQRGSCGQTEFRRSDPANVGLQCFPEPVDARLEPGRIVEADEVQPCHRFPKLLRATA